MQNKMQNIFLIHLSMSHMSMSDIKTTFCANTELFGTEFLGAMTGESDEHELFNPRKSALEIFILSYKSQLKKAKRNALFYDTKKAVTTEHSSSRVTSFNSYCSYSQIHR